MINIKRVYINEVKKNSIADEIGLKKGDYILSINNEEIIDILDYKFNIADEYVELEIEHEDSSVEIYEIEKDIDDDLGIEFESELIDKPKRCHNNCIFCFMNQLPPKVRETLVFKDDDYRLSFFTGNYITLTNMKEEDIKRIIRYRLEPINISIHATDKEVRKKMLNNKNAGEVLRYLDLLYDAGMKINTQIVLCKGINDGKILEKTIKDLGRYAPYLKSICIVPVGLSKFRDSLYPLELLTKQDCIEVIDMVSKYQEEFKKKYKTPLVYLADEFYLKSGMRVPKYSDYGNFGQIEDGIGMISSFDHDFIKALSMLKQKVINSNKYLGIKKKITLITGKITEEYITKKAKAIMKILPNTEINVVAPVNKYFGENITVTGLLTGIDIQNTLLDKRTNNEDLGEYIVLPRVMLKEDEDIFLDDTKLEELQKNIDMKIVVTDGSAQSFIQAILVDIPKDQNIYKLCDEVDIQSYENSILF